MKKFFLSLMVFAAMSLSAQTPTILDNLEQQPFLTCGNCGNTNSAGATATYTVTTQPTPSRDGLAATFSIASPNAPYSNGYFYQKRLGTVTATHFEYEFDLLIPSSALAPVVAPQAIEFECQQNLSGLTYNYAWQALFTGTKTWRFFDKVNRRWVNSGIPVNLAPDVWHHIKAEYVRPDNNHVVYLALTVDGYRNVVNQTQLALSSGGKDYVSNAFQLDTNKYGTAYSVLMDKLTLKYW